MSTAPLIRPAAPGDAEAISVVIVAALRISNAADYPPAVIERVAAGFSPEHVAALVAGRRTLVAVWDGSVVGTAALDGPAVRSVFVLPKLQGRGIGTALMAEIMRMAAAEGAAALTLQSSLTARGFYARLGFDTLTEAVHGEERTFIMCRPMNTPLRRRGGV